MGKCFVHIVGIKCTSRRSESVDLAAVVLSRQRECALSGSRRGRATQQPGELRCSIWAVLCSRPGLSRCAAHRTASLVIALSLRLRGYEPEDWHRAACQAVQMHRVQSSLWSKGLDAKKGLARRAEAVCSETDDTDAQSCSFRGYESGL